MPRRPAAITQADVARAIRAARQAGADRVEVRIGERATIVIHLAAPADGNPHPAAPALANGHAIVL